MKFLIQLMALLGLMVAGASLHAAPRAAEDPSAVVISSGDSAPIVKRQAPKQVKATPRKTAGSKNSQPATSKKAKPARKANKR